MAFATLDSGGEGDPAKQMVQGSRQHLVFAGIFGSDRFPQKPGTGKRHAEIEQPKITDNRQRQQPDAVISFSEMFDHQRRGNKEQADLQTMINETHGGAPDQFLGERHAVDVRQ